MLHFGIFEIRTDIFVLLLSGVLLMLQLFLYFLAIGCAVLLLACGIGWRIWWLINRRKANQEKKYLNLIRDEMTVEIQA